MVLVPFLIPLPLWAKEIVMVYFIDSNGCVKLSTNVSSTQRSLAHKRAKEPLHVKRFASTKEAKGIIHAWVAAHR